MAADKGNKLKLNTEAKCSLCKVDRFSLYGKPHYKIQICAGCDRIVPPPPKEKEMSG